MKLWLKKVKMLSFKAKKAKLAEASIDTQPAWECEGHTGERAFLGAYLQCPWWRGTLAVRCVSSLRTEAGRMLPPHTAPSVTFGASGSWMWRLISTWFLWTLQVEVWGLRLSLEEGPWHCVWNFDLRSGYQRSSQRHQVPRDRQKSSRVLHAFCPLFY